MSVHIRQVRAKDFDEILKINGESSPHVAKLDDEELRRLTALASIALVATDSVRVVGYLLAISSSVVYEGEEFQSFLARINEPFLHIDQVAVCATARGASIASQMYACLHQRSHELGIWTLCCGVNLQPANPVSMGFHRKIGFESICELETSDGQLVALLRKETLPVSSVFRAIIKTNEQEPDRASRDGEDVDYPLEALAKERKAEVQFAKEQLELESPDVGKPAWICSSCGEGNPGNFEICWKCQSARAGEVINGKSS